MSVLTVTNKPGVRISNADLHTICCALRVASEIYLTDASKIERSHERKRRTSEVECNCRLIDTFRKQAADCDALLERIED